MSVNTPTRILDKPEVEEAQDNDYILIDNATEGTRRISVYNLRNQPEPPDPHNYLYKWDFTKSLTDEINGVVAVLGNNASYTEGVGVSMNKQPSYIRLDNSGEYIMKVGKTVEIDFNIAQKNFSSGHGRLITIRGRGDSGFIYRGQTNWQVYRNTQGWKSYISTSENADIFNNATMKMVFLQNRMDIYSNDILVYSGGSILYNENYQERMVIGSEDGQNYYNLLVTGVRIYENEE